MSNALTTSVGDAESRMNALAEKDKNLIALAQKVDALAKRFEALFGQWRGERGEPGKIPRG